MTITTNYKVSDLISEKFTDNTTDVGRKISSSLIRVASTRIFTNPEQSVMELISNSIDSYNIPHRTNIGKFGMGFFSILYFLTRDRTLTIESNNFKATLTFESDGLTLNYVETSNVIRGTRLSINCSDDNFSKENIDNFTNEIMRMKRTKHVNIFLNDELITDNESVYGDIRVTLNKDVLICEDHGSGITKDLLLSTMLVPSCSSKKRLTSVVDELIPPIIKNGNSSFKIYVNDVCIVSIDSDVGQYEYIINLPVNAKLPVSRDDIIYGELEINSLETSLNMIIDNIISESKDLIPFFKLFDEYVMKNKQSSLFVLSTKIKEELMKKDIYFIPFNKFFEKLINVFNIQNYCYYEHCDRFSICKKLEPLLNPYIDEKVFSGRKCISMELPGNNLIEMNELPMYLFINGDITNESVINKVITSTSTCFLFKYSVGKVEQYDSGRRGVNNDIAYTNFLSTIEKKFQNITVDSTKFKEYISLFSKVSDDQQLENFISLVTNKIASFNLVFPYGSEKRVEFFRFYYTIGSEQQLPVLKFENSDDMSRLANLCKYINRKLFIYILSLISLTPFDKLYIPEFSYYINTDIFMSVSTDMIEDFMNNIHRCISDEELFIFVLTSVKYIRYTNGTNNNVFTYLLDEIRLKLDNENLFFHIDRMAKYILGGNVEITSIVNMLIKSMNYYVSSFDLKVFDYQHLDHDVSFTCKDLLQYVYKNEIDNDFKFTDIESHNDIQLQIVEIACNEGTTKPFSDAVMTELLNNSIDAIKSKSLDKVSTISVQTYPNAIVIEDTIGIENHKYMISLLIPFLSSKDPNDINVTGEMGTGFFNVYRQPYTKFVLIEVGNLIINATPLFANGIVVDIRYNLTMRSDQFNGMKVSIVFNKNEISIINNVNVFVKDKTGYNFDTIVVYNKEEQYIVDNLDKIKNSTGRATKNNAVFSAPELTSILSSVVKNVKKSLVKKDIIELIVNYIKTVKPKSIIDIDLNSEKYEKSVKRIFSIEGVGEVLIMNETKRSMVYSNNSYFSDLFTYSSLNPYIISQFARICDHSVIINFYKEFLIPTQGRNELKFKDMDKARLLFNDGLFFAILHFYNHHPGFLRGLVIHNSESVQNIHQLRIYIAKPSYNYKSAVDNNQLLMNIASNYIPAKYISCISGYINDEINNKSTKCNSIPSNTITFDDTLLPSAIKIWFSNKDRKVHVKENIFVVSKGGNGEKVKVDEYIKTHWQCMQLFINEYWRLLKLLIKDGQLVGVCNIQNTPMILYGKCENQSTGGFYNDNTNCIVINTDHYDVKAFDKSIHTMKNMNRDNALYYLQSDSQLIKYFANNSVTVLIHELGHAVQNSNHNCSTHGMTDISMYGKCMMFDDMCLNIYNKLIQKGLLVNFIDTIISK